MRNENIINIFQKWYSYGFMYLLLTIGPTLLVEERVVYQPKKKKNKGP